VRHEWAVRLRGPRHPLIADTAAVVLLGKTMWPKLGPERIMS